jgi:hypothetical protein
MVQVSAAIGGLVLAGSVIAVVDTVGLYVPHDPLLNVIEGVKLYGIGNVNVCALPVWAYPLSPQEAELS